MPCYHPITGWWSRERTEKGLRKVVFNPVAALDNGHMVTIPCGKCIGCRLERSRQWAMRCLHEASLYLDNCFITLTYDDQHLKDNSLHKEDFQKFMKRLRKEYPDRNIRYYHCGEYGDENKRPHYHACLFNFDPDDKILYKTNEDYKLWISPKINDIWGKGYCIIGDVTFDSAAYVARYIEKKLLTSDKEKKEAHYQGREPEYTTMSRRPGIGRGWYDKYKTDLYPHDYTVINERKVKPPKFYDNILKQEDPDAYQSIKDSRISKIRELTPQWARLMGFSSQIEDMDEARRAIKEYCKTQKLKLRKKQL